MLTQAFANAAQMRAKTLGLEGHPLVVMPHPLASRSEAEVKTFAADLVEDVARGLTDKP